MQAKYAFFDIDGTLIRKDSFLLILKTSLWSEPYRLILFVPFIPLFIATVFLSLDKKYVKSAILWVLTFGKGKRGSVIYLRDVLKPVWANLWFSEASNHITNLQKQNINLCFVTASCSIWMRPLLRKYVAGNNVFIGSKLTYFLGGVCFKSKNCYNNEKVVRIKEYLGDNIEWFCGYSDNSVDIPMLLPCSQKFIINPTSKSLVIFKETFKENCRVLSW